MGRPIEIRLDRGVELYPQDLLHRAAACQQPSASPHVEGDRQDQDASGDERQQESLRALPQELTCAALVAHRRGEEAGEQKKQRHRDSVAPQEDPVEQPARRAIVDRPQDLGDLHAHVWNSGVQRHHQERRAGAQGVHRRKKWLPHVCHGQSVSQHPHGVSRGLASSAGAPRTTVRGDAGRAARGPRCRPGCWRGSPRWYRHAR